jgi:hypothetical protein
MNSDTAVTENEIVLRMRELRSAGIRGVDKLHSQAQRVTDWREHVRAQPAVAATAATLLGFFAVRTLVGGSRLVNNSTSQLGQSVHSEGVRIGESLTSRPKSSVLWSVVGNVASTVARQWLTRVVQKQLGEMSHAAKSNHTVERSDTTTRTAGS